MQYTEKTRKGLSQGSGMQWFHCNLSLVDVCVFDRGGVLL